MGGRRAEEDRKEERNRMRRAQEKRNKIDRVLLCCHLTPCARPFSQTWELSTLCRQNSQGIVAPLQGLNIYQEEVDNAQGATVANWHRYTSGHRTAQI